jgi:hypothetical protein
VTEPRWLRRAGNGLLAMVVLGPSVVTWWEFRHDVNVDRKLRRDGVVVDGEVFERRTRSGQGDLLFGEMARVRFTTRDGRSVETAVTVGDLPRVGPTKVRYLRTDPFVARLVSDPVPRKDNWWLVAAATVLGGIVVILVKWITRIRRSRRADSPATEADP